MSTNKSKQLVCIKCPRCERHEGVPKPHSPRSPHRCRPAFRPPAQPAPRAPYPRSLGFLLPSAWGRRPAEHRTQWANAAGRRPPPQGRARARQWPALSSQNCQPSGARHTWSPGPPRVPPPGTPGSRSPKGSVQPHPRPHPQPCPASLVLSHHGDCISKWEGLESPHILPPPTRVPLRPTFRGSWRRQAPEAREAEGHTSPWGSLFSSPAHCQAGATAQMSPSWAQGQLGPLPLLLGSSGVPVPWELCMCTVVTPGPQPA